MNHNTSTITRRSALKLATAAGLSFISRPGSALAGLQSENSPPLFRIGACDWSIGQRQNIAAFQVAKEIGLDGIQVSFDDVGTEFDLRKESARKAYAEAAQETGIAVASLAMGILNRIPYSSSPKAEQWVHDAVEVMPKMDQKILLLAFFGEGDIKGKPELTREVIARLKRVAPKAEKAGVLLGLETWLNVEEHLHIIDSVGSPAVKVYYDTANSNKMGYDIYKEIKTLGRDRICQFHCKENGFLLGHGRIDFKKLRAIIDEIGYKGWLIIEGAVGDGLGIQESYKHNQKYLREVFGV